MPFSPRNRQRTWFPRFLGIALLSVLFLLASAPTPVSSQFLPDLKGRDASLTPQDFIPVFSQGSVEIAPLFLDGRIVGTVPGFIQVKSNDQRSEAEGRFSVRERSHSIHGRLQKILTNLDVYSKSRLKTQGVDDIASQKQELNRLLNVFVDKDSRGTKVMSNHLGGGTDRDEHRCD